MKQKIELAKLELQNINDCVSAYVCVFACAGENVW